MGFPTKTIRKNRNDKQKKKSAQGSNPRRTKKITLVGQDFGRHKKEEKSEFVGKVELGRGGALRHRTKKNSGGSTKCALPFFQKEEKGGGGGKKLRTK